MLTIKRQFSLPNCILILEGFNTDGTSAARPLLSTLTQFECHFGNESQIIRGRRELLNALAECVHRQAQTLLSGIHSKPGYTPNSSLTLNQTQTGNFQLKIAESLLSEAESRDATSSPDDGLELTLNAVQLFDLVEAFDQMMEDTQTLPDLALQLRPLSRKEAQSQEAAAQKLIPVSLGVVSLALVTGLSFVMPIPDIKKPTAPEGNPSSESIDSESGQGSPPSTPPNASTDPATPSSESSEPEILDTPADEGTTADEIAPESASPESE